MRGNEGVMNLKIISEKTLSQYLNSDKILLIDLRSRKDYNDSHIPGAIWMDWEHAEEDTGAAVEHFYQQHGVDPEWIILYCDAGRISLLIARDLAGQGYPVMSLNGGFHRWHMATERDSRLTSHV